MKKKVLIAMSGGVDSSVACLLLKKSGFECIGATIKTWPKEECGEEGSKMCCSFDSVGIAKNVASVIGIPHYVFDFSKEFRTIVRDYFDREYLLGRTPNPCIYCNSAIKFGALLNKADELDCDLVASGHFAQTAYDKKAKKYLLKKGKDSDKDQSYFLFNLKQHQLSRLIFPLGGTTKVRARTIAKEASLKSHDRPSSQDVCFIHKKFPIKAGPIIFRDGSVMGAHKGVSQYTIGQRKGLGIGYKEPLFVTKIDASKNILYVGTKDDIYKKSIIADNVNWINDVKLPLKAKAKVRYGQKEMPCTVSCHTGTDIMIKFSKPVMSPAPGQAVVFYKGSIVLGGAWIKEVPE